jgi:hypothetical protein
MLLSIETREPFLIGCYIQWQVLNFSDQSQDIFYRPTSLSQRPLIITR